MLLIQFSVQATNPQSFRAHESRKGGMKPKVYDLSGATGSKTEDLLLEEVLRKRPISVITNADQTVGYSRKGPQFRIEALSQLPKQAANPSDSEDSVATKVLKTPATSQEMTLSSGQTLSISRTPTKTDQSKILATVKDNECTVFKRRMGRSYCASWKTDSSGKKHCSRRQTIYRDTRCLKMQTTFVKRKRSMVEIMKQKNDLYEEHQSQMAHLNSIISDFEKKLSEIRVQKGDQMNGLRTVRRLKLQTQLKQVRNRLNGLTGQKTEELNDNLDWYEETLKEHDADYQSQYGAAKAKWSKDFMASKDGCLTLYRRKRNLWLARWKKNHRCYGASMAKAKALFKARWEKFNEDFEAFREREGERFEANWAATHEAYQNRMQDSKRLKYDIPLDRLKRKYQKLSKKEIENLKKTYASKQTILRGKHASKAAKRRAELSVLPDFKKVNRKWKKKFLNYLRTHKDDVKAAEKKHKQFKRRKKQEQMLLLKKMQDKMDGDLKKALKKAAAQKGRARARKNKNYANMIKKFENAKKTDLNKFRKQWNKVNRLKKRRENAIKKFRKQKEGNKKLREADLEKAIKQYKKRWNAKHSLLGPGAKKLYRAMQKEIQQLQEDHNDLRKLKDQKKRDALKDRIKKTRRADAEKLRKMEKFIEAKQAMVESRNQARANFKAKTKKKLRDFKRMMKKAARRKVKDCTKRQLRFRTRLQKKIDALEKLKKLSKKQIKTAKQLKKEIQRLRKRYTLVSIKASSKFETVISKILEDEIKSNPKAFEAFKKELISQNDGYKIGNKQLKDSYIRHLHINDPKFRKKVKVEEDKLAKKISQVHQDKIQQENKLKDNFKKNNENQKEEVQAKIVQAQSSPMMMSFISVNDSENKLEDLKADQKKAEKVMSLDEDLKDKNRAVNKHFNKMKKKADDQLIQKKKSLINRIARKAPKVKQAFSSKLTKTCKQRDPSSFSSVVDLLQSTFMANDQLSQKPSKKNKQNRTPLAVQRGFKTMARATAKNMDESEMKSLKQDVKQACSKNSKPADVNQAFKSMVPHFSERYVTRMKVLESQKNGIVDGLKDSRRKKLKENEKVYKDGIFEQVETQKKKLEDLRSKPKSTLTPDQVLQERKLSAQVIPSLEKKLGKRSTLGADPKSILDKINNIKHHFKIRADQEKAKLQDDVQKETNNIVNANINEFRTFAMENPQFTPKTLKSVFVIQKAKKDPKIKAKLDKINESHRVKVKDLVAKQNDEVKQEQKKAAKQIARKINGFKKELQTLRRHRTPSQLEQERKRELATKVTQYEKVQSQIENVLNQISKSKQGIQAFKDAHKRLQKNLKNKFRKDVRKQTMDFIRKHKNEKTLFEKELAKKYGKVPTDQATKEKELEKWLRKRHSSINEAFNKAKRNYEAEKKKDKQNVKDAINVLKNKNISDVKRFKRGVQAEKQELKDAHLQNLGNMNQIYDKAHSKILNQQNGAMRKLEKQMREATELAKSTPKLTQASKQAHERNMARLNRNFVRAVKKEDKKFKNLKKDLEKKYNKIVGDERKQLNNLLTQRNRSHGDMISEKDKILAQKRKQMENLAAAEIDAAKNLRNKNLKDFESKQAERDALLMKEIEVLVTELTTQTKRIRDNYNDEFEKKKAALQASYNKWKKEHSLKHSQKYATHMRNWESAQAMYKNKYDSKQGQFKRRWNKLQGELKQKLKMDKENWTAAWMAEHQQLQAKFAQAEKSWKKSWLETHSQLSKSHKLLKASMKGKYLKKRAEIRAHYKSLVAHLEKAKNNLKAGLSKPNSGAKMASSSNAFDSIITGYKNSISSSKQALEGLKSTEIAPFTTREILIQKQMVDTYETCLDRVFGYSRSTSEFTCGASDMELKMSICVESTVANDKLKCTRSETVQGSRICTKSSVDKSSGKVTCLQKETVFPEFLCLKKVSIQGESRCLQKKIIRPRAFCAKMTEVDGHRVCLDQQVFYGKHQWSFKCIKHESSQAAVEVSGTGNKLSKEMLNKMDTNCLELVKVPNTKSKKVAFEQIFQKVGGGKFQLMIAPDQIPGGSSFSEAESSSSSSWSSSSSSSSSSEGSTVGLISHSSEEEGAVKYDQDSILSNSEVNRDYTKTVTRTIYHPDGREVTTTQKYKGDSLDNLKKVNVDASPKL